jgi:hypothetical protein
MVNKWTGKRQEAILAKATDIRNAVERLHTLISEMEGLCGRKDGSVKCAECALKAKGCDAVMMVKPGDLVKTSLEMVAEGLL